MGEKINHDYIEEDWYGLYREGWKGFIVPSSTSHPAKYARALIRRIYKLAIDEGWLLPGDTVIDPFGGVALGALDAITSGVNWVGNELEKRWVTLGAGGECDGKPIFEETEVGAADGWYVEINDEDFFNSLFPANDVVENVYIGKDEEPVIGAPPSVGFDTDEDAMNYIEKMGIENARPYWTHIDPHVEKKVIRPAICGLKEEHPPHEVDGNIPYWHRTYAGKLPRWGNAVLLKGDSRYLVKVIRDNAEVLLRSGISIGMDVDLSLSSPPFLQQSGGTNVTANSGVLSDHALINRHSAGNHAAEGYGADAGQIGNMDDLNFDAAILSPPYAEIRQDGGKEARENGYSNFVPYSDDGVDVHHTSRSQENMGNLADNEAGFNAAIASPPFTGMSADGGWQMLGKYAEEGKLTVKQVDGDPNKLYPSWDKGRDTSYGQSPENLANLPEGDVAMAVGSPPYADIPQSGGTKGLIEHGTGLTQGERCFDEYGNTPGQIGRMKADGFDGSFSSPPFEKVTADKPSKGILKWIADGNLPHMGPASYGNGYGDEEGQIGASFGEDFWTASRMVLDNLYVLLRPGARAIFITKRYVKDKKVVEFSEKWAMLCEASGFRLERWIKAWVIEDKGTQMDMFGDPKRIITSRKSFFRRLAEAHGSPPIDWEDVLVFVKE